MQETKNQIGTSKELSYKDWQVQRWNEDEGTMPGNDCRICNNKGHIMIIQDGYQALKECKCMPARKSLIRIKKSGLEKLLDEYTFDKFKTEKAWQKHIKDTALNFIENTFGNWFYIGGQVGAGKSHVCTAIVIELINRGNAALYMKWRDDSINMKRSIMSDDQVYADEMNKYKTVKVLYIDDFFKTERGKAPSAADINLAFELLNYRYNNKDLVTIISSELSMQELLDVDEAIGSRIYQRSKGYYLAINKDSSKNMRMKGSTL